MVSQPPAPPNGATTNLPPEVLSALAQAGAPAFQAPRGIQGLGTPAMNPPRTAPPVSGEDVAVDGAPTPDAVALQAVTPTDDVENEPNADEEDDRDIDDLGRGDNPIQGPRGHSHPSFQHPLDRAANQVRSELQDTSRRMAESLFPQGPAGSSKLSRKAMLDYVGRHWDDPSDPQGSAEFRKTLLDRVAPKGPDGKRLASGIRTFLGLYRDAVETPGKARVAQPLPEPAPAQHPAAGPGMAAPPPGPPFAPPGAPPPVAQPMPAQPVPPQGPPMPPPGPNQLPPMPPP